MARATAPPVPGRDPRAGFALLGAVIAMLICGVAMAVVVSLVATDSGMALVGSESARALGVARAGLEHAIMRYNAGGCGGVGVAAGVGPGSFVTTGTLYRPTPVALAAVITPAVTVIPVSATAGFAPHGRLRIDDELIDYAATTATSFTGARRGVGGTTAAGHTTVSVAAQSQCLIRSTGTVNAALGAVSRVVEAAVPATPFVQAGTAVNAANGTLTVALPSRVDPARAFLIFSTRHNNGRPVGSMLRGRIATATTLEFTRDTNEAPPLAINIHWYVVDYLTGVRVQRGEVAQAALTVNVPITPVAALNQAFVTWSKTPSPSNGVFSDDDPILGELTTTANLQFRNNEANLALPTHTIRWQVIEYTNAADIRVQKGTIAMAAAATTVTAVIPTAVNTAGTFVLVGYRALGGGNDIGARMLRARLTTPTNIVIDRGIAGASTVNEIVWQAVELFDGSLVQHANETFAAGTAQRIVPLATAVDPTRSVAFASVQPVGGQNMGRTSYNANDLIGVGSVTAALAATQLTLDRNSTVAATDIGWFAVQFARGRMTAWREIYP